MTGPDPILILGAGINGAALARELVLNGVPVCVVDRGDLASGTTAFSSRLIHGGLRYLEYGDVALVRQSLRERERLLQLAPQYVRPLRLVIPLQRRGGGLLQAAARFCGLERAGARQPSRRGLWLVRCGLWLYDRYAGGGLLPPHQVHQVGEPHLPPVCPDTFRWMCSYFDAQIRYPERLVVAMLADARQLAEQQRLWFRVFTYHEATLEGDWAVVRAGAGGQPTRPAARFRPAAVVNATGAWVDHTLRSLHINAPRLIGGTKGSHLLVANAALRQALGDCGVYVEAEDGRPVFLLPLGELTLVGTTDLPFDQPPETARASDGELDYLLGAVQRVFPQIPLARGDIQLHYSGVRPLPFCTNATPASVTRRHSIHHHRDAPVPLYSIIGGKLTTCRSLAEEVTAMLLDQLGLPLQADSRQRRFPGAEAYPRDDDELQARQAELAQRRRCSPRLVAAAWQLYGTAAEGLLCQAGDDGCETREVPGTGLPLAVVRHAMRQEWVTRLDDLVERRLMLLYNRSLSRRCLHQLAQLMADEGLIEREEIERQVAACVERLARRYGRNLDDSFSDRSAPDRPMGHAPAMDEG